MEQTAAPDLTIVMLGFLRSLVFHEHEWEEYFHIHDGPRLKRYVRCNGCNSEDIIIVPPPPPKAEFTTLWQREQ